MIFLIKSNSRLNKTQATRKTKRNIGIVFDRILLMAKISLEEEKREKARIDKECQELREQGNFERMAEKSLKGLSQV